MIVTAMLCWYDEPVKLLRECVKGAATIADRIVAADGAYELVPDKHRCSHSRQADVIQDTALGCGLSYEFLKPQIWPGQVAKRDAVLQRAKEGSDWVMTLDADWLISGDRQAIREELQAVHEARYDQVTVGFVQPENPDRSVEEACANIWHEQETGQWRQIPLIYRAMPVMNYRKNHWSLFAEDEQGRQVGLWGGAGHLGYEFPKTAYLKAEHLFEHRCLFRQQKQIHRNRAYISERDLAVAAVGYET